MYIYIVFRLGVRHGMKWIYMHYHRVGEAYDNSC